MRPPDPSSERISMCYIKYMAGTYSIHSTVHPIVSIKGDTLVTITSSSVVISLLVPGRDGLVGYSVYVSVGLYPRGRDDRVILVPKFVASGNKTQGPYNPSFVFSYHGMINP